MLKKVNQETGVWAGAVCGALMFLAAGLLPALLYGGYLGVIVGSSLMGGPIQPGGPGTFLIAVGMVVGTASVGFLFIVAGAAIGACLGLGYAKATGTLPKSGEER